MEQSHKNMKTILKISLLLSIAIIFASCEDTMEIVTLQKSGTVVDYSGSGNCGFIIELEDGNSILPIYYPEDFTFGHGQYVWVEYTEIPNIDPLCDRGMPCEISAVEELGCASYVELSMDNYDSLSFDPVFIHELYLDEDCLHIKLSYSGGCEDHTIDFARINKDGLNQKAVFEIRHNGNGDMCEAYFTKDLRFDISDLALEGIHEFTVYAKLDGQELYSETFDYNY